MSIFTNSAARSIEEASAYTQAILALLDDRDPLEVLPKTPAAIRTLVANASTDELRTPEAEGKWSIGMVAQHLADSELVWGWRLRMVLAQDRPAITGYDQDAWAARLRYTEVAIDDALGDFERQRVGNLRLLSRMPEADRTRVGVHAERGEESVAHMMRLYAGHDLLHLRQIERIKQKVGVRS
jgi:uncharacterized damage-inducible protein DinB